MLLIASILFSSLYVLCIAKQHQVLSTADGSRPILGDSAGHDLRCGRSHGSCLTMQVQQPAHLLQHSIPEAVQHSQISLLSTWQRLMMDRQAIRDFVVEYASELKDLTFNSKSLINTLTMLAGDNPEAASSIAAAIEKHILTVRLVLAHVALPC